MSAFKLNQIGSEVTGIDDTLQQLQVLFMTEKGSLPGDPNYGLAISQYIPYRDESKPLIIGEIMNAIGRYQSSIRVQKIEFEGERVTVRIESIGTITI
ncbi:MAG: hypothetical protein DI617_08395 [Streptococcus pyogenes]|nr:MAG: hypothetical protein DI617_08395 [Streptococcus pyogenes]